VRVTREVRVAAPPAALWAILWDVPRMVGCVPNCVGAREVEPERRYVARMSQRVGPISLKMNLDVEIVEADAPRRIALRARGRDAMIGAEIALRVTLECAEADGGSALRIDADGQVLGKLGGLAHGVVQRKAEEAVDQFAARLSAAAAAA
jgi:carbon monoxide dehydrogenase subunit G